MDNYQFNRFRALLEREISGMSDQHLDVLETIIYAERVERSERVEEPITPEEKDECYALHAAVSQADTVAALAAHEACPTYRNW
ncbi:MAG: hypothetical protein ACO1HP_04040 [Bacteroidota bacterium]